MKFRQFLTIIGPGLLVAATGVGAGDLATGSFAGSHLGTAILWAVVLGAFLKYIVTEGIARWQLATGTSILEGSAKHLGKAAIWIFLPYLLVWSFFTGSALISACGVTLHAIFPVFSDPVHGKIFFGVFASLGGWGLVAFGGYRLFERIMRLCIGIMFITVVCTAMILWPGFIAVAKGLFIPTIPDIDGQGLTWTIALIGGVGGTVTVLSYGYWIREEGRLSGEELGLCRIDLATGYVMTAVFGLAVVIIGSQVVIEGSGATLLVRLSEQLHQATGVTGKWLFLIGSFGAVFSSLLGVWQATPYFFADSLSLVRSRRQQENTVVSPEYRYYLAAMAVVPIAGLFTSFREVQRIYAMTGAFFIPLLALSLLLLNGRGSLVGQKFKNGLPTTAGLAATLLFFFSLAVMGIFD